MNGGVVVGWLGRKHASRAAASPGSSSQHVLLLTGCSKAWKAYNHNVSLLTLPGHMGAWHSSSSSSW
jgi:hypothetical protein